MAHLKILLAACLTLFMGGGANLFGQQTLTVTATGDKTTVPYTSGQLRWAIDQANAYTGGTTLIKFNLPVSGTNPALINLNAALPKIFKTTVIDGTTQPGYQAGKPMVVIDGSTIPPPANQSSAFYFDFVVNGKVLGLYIRNFAEGIVFDHNSTFCEASYNVINQNTRSNILIKSSSDCIVKGNFINTDMNLMRFPKNSEEGIFLSNDANIGSTRNIIGGVLCGEGNTIAYTGSEGIDNNPNLGANPTLNVSNIYSGNVIFENVFDAIELRNPNGANSNKSAPAITTTGCITTGTAEPNDIIELFGSTGPLNGKKNANQYMKTVVADAQGNWTANFDFIEYSFITATARDSRNNTSELAPAKAITPSKLDFTFPEKVCLREPIIFTNLTTTCAGSFAFQWDFGDGSGLSTTGVHTYTSPGQYTVKLTIQPSIYCKTITKTRTILIKECCNNCETLDFLVPAVCVKDSAAFINISSCPGNPSYTWNFGDGTGNTSNNFHVYTTLGTYTVTLTKNGSPECPGQSVTKTITVSECIQPCINCIGSFAPDAGQYVLSAWEKEDVNNPNILSYLNPEIYIDFPTTNSPTGTPSSPLVGPFIAGGIIIDGWQRVDTTFAVPASATYINIRLQCATRNCFFDDIRIFPYDGSMKSYVYDPINLRLVAELDERNYATLYEYDEEGKLVRVKKETEKGIMTIKENKTNTLKKQ